MPLFEGLHSAEREKILVLDSVTQMVVLSKHSATFSFYQNTFVGFCACQHSENFVCEYISVITNSSAYRYVYIFRCDNLSSTPVSPQVRFVLCCKLDPGRVEGLSCEMEDSGPDGNGNNGDSRPSQGVPRPSYRIIHFF